MLMTLLALLVMPRPAAQGPCQSPQWMMSSHVALSCDFADAAAAARHGANEFVGPRTHTGFIITPVSTTVPLALVISDRRSSSEDATVEAIEVGADAGWVLPSGQINSDSGGWTAQLRTWGLDTDDVPAGTLVEIVAETRMHGLEDTTIRPLSPPI
jgi:hypothetical protein